MKINQLFFVLAICFLGSGCRLLHNGWRTTIAEPSQYARDTYDKWAHRRFRGLAANALDQATCNARADLDDYCCEPFTVDYRLGFIDGFVDFLEAGGSGNPSPLPPRRYWRAKYQSPAGYECTQDWFRGFQHGASAADASNYRTFVTVPLSDSVTMDTRPYAYGPISIDEPIEHPIEDSFVDGEHPGSTDAGNRTDAGQPQLARVPVAAKTQ